MKTLRRIGRPLISFAREEDGQDLLEYTLLVAFLALATFGLLAGVKGSISTIWTAVNTDVSAATSAVS